MNEVLQHDLVFQHLLKMLQLNQSRQLLHDEQHQTVHLTYLERFEELVDSGVGLVCLHYGVEVPKGKAGEIMLKGMGGGEDILEKLGGKEVLEKLTESFKNMPGMDGMGGEGMEGMPGMDDLDSMDEETPQEPVTQEPGNDEL